LNRKFFYGSFCDQVSIIRYMMDVQLEDSR